MPSILFIFTSVDTTSDGKPTGWYLPEAAHPYAILSAEPSIEIDFASPKGANPPLDAGSVKAFEKDEESVKFLKDEVVKSKLASAKKLSEVTVGEYDAILYIGGHGPVIDLPEDPVNVKFATEFNKAGKIISAVCHGTAALAYVKTEDGKSIFSGKKFTGFSTAEETAGGSLASVPFLLEDKIVADGGLYEKADELWGAKVVVDGNLYTGQNPASAGPLAKELLKALLK